jgi:cadmium resistance transport/sequestration family protein
MLELIALGIAAFVSTNIDDIFLLMVFFSDTRFSPLQIVAGQYAGMAALVVASLLAALATVAIPDQIVGLMGLLPIAIGIKELLELRKGNDNEAQALPNRTRMGFLTVAAVTVSNGADNIGVYIPLFAIRTPAEMLMIVLIFAVMTGVWCAAGYGLVHNPIIGERIRRVGRVLLPFVLIGLGVYILVEAFFKN